MTLNLKTHGQLFVCPSSLSTVLSGDLEEMDRRDSIAVIKAKAEKLDLPFSLHPEDSFDISYNRFKLSCQLIRSFMSEISEKVKKSLIT